LNLKKSRLAWLLAILAVFSLFAAACSDDDDSGDSADSSTPADDGGSDEPAAGEVFVTGSSTVEPISVAVAEAFADENPDVAVSVEGPGTGDGFEAFCNGEADISDASRPIKAEEVEACEANGIDFIELKVGIDGIAVMTSPANSTVECLSFVDLYALIGPEAEGFANWSDAQDLAAELESDTTFPDAPLDITGPGEESGTYDSFIEIVLEGIGEARFEEGVITEDQAATTRPDYTASADDNVIIQGIEGSDSSLGWVGFAFAEEAGDGVSEIAISEEVGGECVAPTAETIQDTSYPISRNLYVYVSATAADENPAVGAYVDFYVADLTTDVEGVGYVALADDAQAETQQVWADRETGTRDGGE
jgi:phosphate transport system substrate-binding protein